jgi:Conserved TM helix
MVVAVSVGNSFQGTLDEIFAFIPRLVAALVILLIGWIIAKFVAGLVRRGLRAAGADRALATGRAGDYKQQFAPDVQPSGVISKIAFWFVFGLAILLAVSALHLAALSAAIAGIVSYLPNVIAAILILLVAIAVAGAVGGLAQRLMGGTMLGKLVQTAVPVLVMTIALFMALVELKIATQIVVATYVLVLGAIALGFALAFGLGGRDVARQMLMGAYEAGQRNAPQLKAEAQQARDEARREAEAVKDKVDAPSPPQPPGATTRPATS